MKRIFTLFVLTLITSNLFAQFPTIYATLGSGSWATTTNWETFTGNATNTPGAQGTGTVASSVPSGTHYVYIRAGHTITMGTSNRSCIGMTVEATGKLWANEATARRLQIANGGTGFLFPQNWAVTNNGEMGGAADGLYYEAGTNAGAITLTGNGVTNIQRIRMPGGLGNQTVSFTIDHNINFTQAANYALSAVYNPAATDNYTITINSGKTATITAATGYFHQNSIGSGGGFGTYTYNINGTLDNTANLGSVNTTTFQPLGAGSTVNLNVSGIYRTGTFNTSTNSGSAGTVNLVVKNGGRLELIAGGAYSLVPEVPVKIEGTGVMVRNVAAADALFPVGVGTSYNPVVLNNSGTADNFDVNVKNTIDNAVNDATKVVNKQWTINEAVAGGSNVTIKLGWVTADQAAGFNPAGSVVIGRWTGSAWQATAATVTGTGTSTDPYIATASGFTAFSPFIVANTAALPVSFAGSKAYAKEKGVQVEWSTATESNINYYSVERSVNGKDFSSIGIVESKGNNSSLTSYSFFDATPVAGTNYYRIKAMDKDGSFKYTAIMQVNISKGKADVIVAPNPVRNNELNVQLSGFAKGNYSVRVLNTTGQVVFTAQVAAENGSINRSFRLPATVKGGIYTLQVAGNDINLNKKIVIE